MTKEKQSGFARGILLAAGILFVCAAVYFLAYDIYAYAHQFEQRDWPVAEATVVHVESRREGRRGHYHTRYNIYYQYEAGENFYTGAIYGINAPKDYGETFPVKYNPKAPADSTHYLEPASGLLVSGMLGFAIFGLVGGMMVRSAWPGKKKAGGGPKRPKSRKETARL